MKLQRWTFTTLLVLFIAALFYRADIVTQAILSAMDGFLHKMLPILFPYMIISRILISQNLLAPLSYIFPMYRLFRLPSSTIPVFWLGNLCGFPIGAKMTAFLHKQGEISSEEASRLCAISGNASPAFIVQAVGVLLWNDTCFGIYLFSIQISFSLICGIILGKLGETHDNHTLSAREYTTECFSKSFCFAVTESASACVALCGYIVCFSALLSLFPFEGVLKTAAAGILECTAGLEDAAMLGGYAGMFFTGFSLGWGGLCITAQIIYVLSDTGISIRPFVRTKFLQGIICGTASVLYSICFPSVLCRDTAATTLSMLTGFTGSLCDFVLPTAVIVLACMHYILYFRKISGKTYNSGI